MVLLYLIHLFEYCVVLNCFSIQLVWNGIIDWILFLFHLIVHDFNWIMIHNRIQVCVIIFELLMRLDLFIPFDSMRWLWWIVLFDPIQYEFHLCSLNMDRIEWIVVFYFQRTQNRFTQSFHFGSFERMYVIEYLMKCNCISGDESTPNLKWNGW